MLRLLEDPENQTLIPLSQIRKSKHIPRLGRGDRVALSTVHRWATRGVNGVQLPVLMVGQTYCSSEAALIRFFQEVTLAGRTHDAGDLAQLPESCGPIARPQRTIQRQSGAAVKLDAIGI